MPKCHGYGKCLARTMIATGTAVGMTGLLMNLYAHRMEKQFNDEWPVNHEMVQRWADRKHILSANQLERQDLDEVIKVAEVMEKKLKAGEVLEVCKGDVLGCLFYEPSTRTMCSFQAAMMRLGGNVIPISEVKNSSVSKGETLEDTIRCLASYCDALALRHKEIGAAVRASKVSGGATICNAGDGAGEHPTQALLDLYTIYREKGRIDNLNITLVGDLKYGRTVHSLAKLFTKLNGVKLTYVSPKILKMPMEIQEMISQTGTPQTENEDLAKVLKDADVLYVTRIQKERFEKPADYEKVKDCYRITKEFLTKANAKPDLTIMHPLPRVNEISTCVDDDTPRAAYFRQMKNGLYVRMALLALLMGKLEA